MLRKTPLWVLAFAVLLLAEPLFHSHPLGGGEPGGIAAPSVCAICAVAAQDVSVVRAVIVAPSTVVDQLIAEPLAGISADVPSARASRAPPAA